MWISSYRTAAAPPVAAAVFPLSIDGGGHFLRQANGTPFFFHGDTPWMLPNNLNNSQIDTYVAWMSSVGFTAALFEAPGFFYSDNTPPENNVDGASPFTTMSPHYNWVINNAYWTRVDYFVNKCKAIGALAIIAFDWFAFGGGTFYNETLLASDATLQAYGVALANRYTQGNVMWSALGDYVGDSTGRAKQWQIINGIRSVRTTDLICAHPNRSADAYTVVGPGGDNLPGWSVGTVYCQGDASDAYSLSATAYGRAGFPFFLIEDGYENSVTLAEFRRSKYQVMMSGGAGTLCGNIPRWHFGSTAGGGGGGADNVLANYLNTTGTQQMQYLRALLTAYQWWLLVPKTDTSLVTTSLGTGIGRVCPALASDGSFAMIYSPAVDVTVNMASLTHSSVRARLFDPTTGTYSVVSGSPFANSGTHAFTIAAESVLVLD